MKYMMLGLLLLASACTKTVYVPTPITYKPPTDLMLPPEANQVINPENINK